MIGVSGLQALIDRLRTLDVPALEATALERAAIALQDAVRRRLSHAPGETHDAPWQRTGALRDSVSYATGRAEAIIGSADPVAVDQELGTRTDPPRPFLAPAASEEAPRLAAAIGAEMMDRLRARLS